MKITIISPPFGEKGTKSDNLQMAPPILEYLASLTLHIRPDAEVRLIDANKEDVYIESIDADLVAFSSLTPQIPWVYAMTDKLRKCGMKTVIGGMHVSALPEEGKLHADCIVVGEAEGVWSDLLRDAEAGCLKELYSGERMPLDKLPKKVKGLLKSSYRFDSFFTTRGCPYQCTFCSVRRFFGSSIRYRPIDEVIEEVAASPNRMLMNIDDNIWGLDMERSIELFRAMATNLKGKYWFGQGDLVTVQKKRGEEMLDWAVKSGLTTVMVGWESSNPESLEDYSAVTKQGKDRADAIRKIRAYGIDVMLFIMVGGRKDSLKDYDEIIELCDRLDVSAHPVMLTPFPGTELYEDYKEYMREGFDWGDFDGNTALFNHEDPFMTPENREQATLWARERLFTWPRIARRLGKISRRGFPMSHVNSFFLQWAHRRAFREYAADHLNPAFDFKKLINDERRSDN